MVRHNRDDDIIGDLGGSYGPVESRKEWDSENFKRRNIDLMTAVILWTLVVVVVILVIGGALNLVGII